MNGRLLIILVVMLADIGSALGVVYARHQSRHLSVQLTALENRQDQAVAEWSRLQLEQAWLADGSEIESKARRHLGMRQPDEMQILLVRP